MEEGGGVGLVLGADVVGWVWGAGGREGGREGDWADGWIRVGVPSGQLFTMNYKF